MRTCSVLKFLFTVWVPLLLFSSAVSATVYSDAENGIDGWFVSDNTPSGATVSSVSDAQLQSQVIQTLGASRSNAYQLGGTSATAGWSNSTQFLLSWKMATSESFAILVHLNTTEGPRRLFYNQSNADSLRNPDNDTIHFGLGSMLADGVWYEHQRNLRLDVEIGEPGNQLLTVNGITVMGSLRLDDMELVSENDAPPVDGPPLPYTLYSDAEDGIDGWVVFDTTPPGASITSVFDTNHGSQVIQTEGDGRDNSYLLGGTIATTGWNNRSEFTLSWDMSTDEPFALVVYIETDLGARRLIYTKSNADSLKNPNNNSIWFGLGSALIGDGWHALSRDLAVDVAVGEPGNNVIEVNGITVSGSLRLDNIRLGDAGDEPDDDLSPTAVIESDALSDTVPQSVVFSAAASTAVAPATIASYAWEFGNGDTAASLGASTTYSSSGSFSVTLQVTDSNGLTDTAAATIVVPGDKPPVANMPTATIDANTLSGSAPLSVTFSAATSAAVSPATLTSYAWNFGNGDTAALSGATTTYTEPGTYTVSLRVTDSNDLSATTAVSIVVQDDNPPVVDTASEAAARLLAQATFGATLDDIAEVRRLGIEAWVDDQFTRQGSPHLEYVRAHPGSASLNGPRQHKWLIDAIDGDDQLRQRVAFAYSEIFVTSDLSQTLDREQYAMTNYYDLLLNSAFGNYRDLLEDITLSPIMGIYLSMLQNGRGDPTTNTRADENYAREIMQLFSIGLYELNLNGTIRRDADNDPLPAYTQANVEEYARVYTGWSYAGTDRFNHEPTDSFTNKFLPMEPFPGFHDFGQKNLLGGAVSPAGISAEQDLDNALDSLFYHSNVGPFIGKQLIKRLVTSNPSPAYVSRVATVFNNNGSGVRGDMRAVIRAILLDTEARSGYSSVPDYGKLREPLIRWTHLWRAFNVQRGGQSANNQYNHSAPYIEGARNFLGQGILSSSSVFNFFHPDFAPLGDIRDARLTAPEAEIYSDANILTTTAKISGLAQLYYQGGNENTRNSSYIDITAETNLASDPAALVDRLDLLLMSGQMSADMRLVLLDHMNSLPSDEAGRSLRVRDGITLIMASPQYLVQK